MRLGSQLLRNLLYKNLSFAMASRASTIVRRIIKTDKAPAAIGPYNQAIQIGDTLYLSGQIGLNPQTMQLAGEDVVTQTEQCLKNLGQVLEAAGASFNNVVKTTVLFADIADYSKVNDVYGKFFTANQPARAAYQVAALPKGARVEIEGVAVVGNITDEK